MTHTYIDASKLCIVCKEITTRGRNEQGDPVCSSCSNEIYSQKVAKGEIVVLNLDMTKVKQFTLTEIRAMIKKDIEEADKPSSTQ